MAVELRGLRELRALLGGFSAEVGGGAEAAAEELARLFLAEARSRAPVLTGALRESIRLSRQGAASFAVEASAPYSGYVEYGSGPHVIEPVRARALRFTVGGETVFAKRVKHPGSSPRPYWRPALSEARREAPATLLEVVRRCL